MDSDQVTIVFVSYNSGQLVDQMLRELDGYRVLVYDNASGDDTVSLIKKDYPLVRLHSSEINRGYGRAANSAFRQSDTPYALLLNPDVEINRGQIDALIASIAKLDNDWLFVAPFTGEGPAAYKTDNNDPLPRISFATGCAMLINLQNHWALEGFDENIFLFFEETDLCKRAIDRQFKMYYAETIRFPHASGQSVAPSPQLNLLKRWHYHWSYLYFCKKHHQWARLLGTVLKNMLVYPVKLLYVDKESEKAKIYRARRSATMAFITGGNAFIDDDLPFIPAADE